MKTAAYVSKYLILELDKLGVKLSQTMYKPEKFKTKIEMAVTIPFESIEDKDYIHNTIRVYAERISKKISEVNYMAIEENSIKGSDDIIIKVLILE